MAGPNRLPDDLAKWVAAVFPKEDAETALELLDGAVDHTGARVGERLLRSAALGSRGRLKDLTEMVALLKIDWRDVIVAGEYEVAHKKLIRVRDLNSPVPGPDEMRGMTVNERLGTAGLFPEFDRSVKARDLEAVVWVLRRAFLTEDQARETATKVLADPSFYGF